MSENTPSPATRPKPLLDQHCNHWRTHGEHLNEVGAMCGGRVERGVSSLSVTSSRHGREGGPAAVRLHLMGGAFGAVFRLTPEDAEAVALWLQQAAGMAREVTALVEAGACK